MRENGSLNKHRLYIRGVLSVMLLGIFCTLLTLIFFVPIPQETETLSSVLLGGLVSSLTSVLSWWFDSTESADAQAHKRLELEDATSS